LLSEKLYWISVLERAVKTFCQAMVAVFAAGLTVLEVDWGQALAISGTAALLSVLTSVASINLGKFDGPSLADEAVVEPLDPSDVKDFT